MDHDSMLDRYARVALEVGVGLREGQRLVVRSPLVAAPLVRRIASAAYRAGSPYVHVVWSDEELVKTRFALAPEDSFEEVPLGYAASMEGMAARGDAFLSIDAYDPESLAGVDAKRVATARTAHQRSMKSYVSYVMADAMPWTVLAAPEPAWARKVFPGEDAATAVAKLWDAIASATRLDQADPVSAWGEHVARLERLAKELDGRRYQALHFRGPGTDLRVGLADGHVWKGGGTATPSGQRFVPNLPTEEVFTAPHWARVDGTVRASLPLSFDGRLISGFSLTFEAGRVVQASAEQGQEVLDRLLDTDDGARRLGEVALVSVDSPVHRSGLLFYETLFDENAASHLALGRAYRFSVSGGVAASEQEATAMGLNESLVHVDFMIGSPDTDVDGVAADGSRQPVMRSGRFVV